MRAIVAQQTHEVAGEQQEQHEQPGDVDQQYRVTQPIELFRVLRGSAQHEQRGNRQHDAEHADDAVDRASYRSSGHSNHSLSSCH